MLEAIRSEMRGKKLAIALAAGVAGFLLNGLSYEVAAHTVIIFGGVFYLLVASLFGPWYGLLAAAVASSRTIVAWGHPWSWAVYSLEGLCTGWLVRRGRALWTADAMFWAGAGLPLLAVLSALHVPHPAVWTLIVKDAANGLLNVGIAELLLLVVPLHAVLSPLADAVPARPFRSALFSTFVLVTILPLAFLQIVNARQTAAERRHEAAERLQQLVVAVDATVEQHLQKHAEAVRELAEAIRAKGDYSPAALGRWLDEAHTIYDGFLTMIVTDEHGMTVASHPTMKFDGTALPANRNVSDRAYFQVPMSTGKTYVSEAFRGRGFGHHAIVAISAPLRRSDGRIAGVVEGSLNLERIERLEEAQHAGAVEIIVLDGTNRVVSASSNAGYDVLSDVGPSPLVQAAMHAGGKGPFSYTARQTPYLAYEDSLPEGWRVIAQLPLAAVSRELDREYNITIAWTLGALLLGMLLVRLASRRMSLSLEGVATAIRSYAPGQAHGIPELSPDAPIEVGHLAAGFAEMAERLNRSYTELRQAKTEAEDANLRLAEALAGSEREVRERTASLAAANAELRTENAMRASIIENSWEGICVGRQMADPPYVRFTVWNERMQAISGYTAEEANREGLYQRILPDRERQARASERMQRMRGGEDLQAEEWEITRKGGEKRHVLVSTRTLPSPAGESREVLAVLLDITERKRFADERARLQEELHHAQRMESLGRMAGGIAHDFNNLLMVINGYSKRVMERLNPRDPARGEMQSIHTAGERAADLTRQLLAFGRKQMVQPKAFNPNHLIMESRDMLCRILGEDICLTDELDPALGWVFADSSQFHQVLVNLCVNAREAMPDGGSLTIATRNAEVAESSPGGNPDVHAGSYVVLSVTDNGVGMNEDVQRRVFEPFFTTKGFGVHSGLGLSTSYGIAAQSGGWISVASKPGAGTRFEVYLPRADRAEEPVEEDAGAGRTERSSGTILVVEDEDAVRKLVVAILKDRGYAVISAGGGAAALAASRAHEGGIDVLVTDVIMRDMNGGDLAGHLTTERPGLHVLFISGYTDDSRVVQGCRESGMAFLSKPFSPDQLLAKVGGLMEGRGPSQEANPADNSTRTS